MVTEQEQPDGYEGEATVAADGGESRPAHAAPAAHFDPIAGRVVWSGRVSIDVPARTGLTIGTPHGTGSAEATEQDAWGNTRVRGTGRPPFPVGLLDAEAPAR